MLHRQFCVLPIALLLSCNFRWSQRLRSRFRWYCLISLIVMFSISLLYNSFQLSVLIINYQSLQNGDYLSFLLHLGRIPPKVLSCINYLVMVSIGKAGKELDSSPLLSFSNHELVPQQPLLMTSEFSLVSFELTDFNILDTFKSLTVFLGFCVFYAQIVFFQGCGGAFNLDLCPFDMTASVLRSLSVWAQEDTPGSCAFPASAVETAILEGDLLHVSGKNNIQRPQSRWQGYSLLLRCHCFCSESFSMNKARKYFFLRGEKMSSYCYF